MKNLFKNMTLFGWIGLGGGVAGLIATIIYTAYSAAVALFAPEVFVMLLLGVAGSAFAAVTEFKFAPLVPVLFYSLAFGLYISDRVLMFEEMYNHIYGMNERGAILGLVIVIFVLMFVSIVATIVSAFFDKTKTVVAEAN